MPKKPLKIDARVCEKSTTCAACARRIGKGDALLADKKAGGSFCAACVHIGLKLVQDVADPRARAKEGYPAWSKSPPRTAGVYWIRPSPRSKRREIARWEPRRSLLAMGSSDTLAEARAKYPELEFWPSRVRLPK